MQIPERLGQNSHFLDLAPTLNEAPCYVVQPLAQAMFFKSAYIKKTLKKILRLIYSINLTQNKRINPNMPMDNSYLM